MKSTKRVYKIYAVTEYHNSGTHVQKFVSNKPITLTRVLRWFDKVEGYPLDSERDSIQLLGGAEVGEVNLDTKKNSL